MNAAQFDVAVIGGGVMGSTTALALARGGMKVVLVERDAVGSGASGVNAGTLSLQVKRVSLMAYALRGHAFWSRFAESFGHDIGFHRTGGLNLAFNDTEADELRLRMGERREAGLPIDFLSGAQVRDREPELSEKIVLASYSPMDGMASSSRTGLALRKAMVANGVDVREWQPVESIERTHGIFDVATPAGRITARRLVLAAGAWTGQVAAMLGVDLPIGYRIHQMSVTERAPRLLRHVVGHITGLMSLKQADNGTIIIGGGWQGQGAPGRPSTAIPANLVGNLRFAQFAMPALNSLRIVRFWFGYDPVSPDVMPLVGDLPGVDQAHIIACVRGGYAIGPAMGELLADAILGREPALPLFDPSRFATATSQTSSMENKVA